MKIVGAMMILLACGGFAFYMVTGYRNHVHNLQQIIQILEFMECELQYRMTPLPGLCRSASQVCTGCVQNVLHHLGSKLEEQITPNAEVCMRAVVQEADISEMLGKHMLQLGETLGRFDLPGQLKGLSSVKKSVELELAKFTNNQDIRIRSYQTLGLCAGVALVILFL